MVNFSIYFIGLLVVGAVLLLPVMAFVRSGEARRTAEALREEIRSLRAERGRTTTRIVGLEKALERALEKLESRSGGVQGPEVTATARVEDSAAETAKTRVVSPDVDKSETPKQVAAQAIPSATPIPTIPSTAGVGSPVPRVPDAGARIPPSAPASQAPNGLLQQLAVEVRRAQPQRRREIGRTWKRRSARAGSTKSAYRLS